MQLDKELDKDAATNDRKVRDFVQSVLKMAGAINKVAPHLGPWAKEVEECLKNVMSHITSVTDIVEVWQFRSGNQGQLDGPIDYVVGTSKAFHFAPRWNGACSQEMTSQELRTVFYKGKCYIVEDMGSEGKSYIKIPGPDLSDWE